MKRAPTRSRPAPRQYPWYFRVITLSLPFLLLAAVEGTFRLAGVARPPALFIRVPAGPHTFLQLNPKIGQRFFPPSMGSGIPVPNFQVCLADKPAGIRRVLCLGESTTAGFPYPEHGSFPALLRTILQERDPGQQWEVLNCGMTGISARTVADLMPELLSVQPDVIVVYLGHNEFYGVGGVGSWGVAGAGPLAWLRHLRLVRWLQERLTPKERASRQGTLMERMVAHSSIPIDSPLRDRAYRRYRGYIDRILDAAQRKGVAVILCELVSNERDLYPFGSAGNRGRSEEIPDLAAWKSGPPAPELARRLLPALERRVSEDSLHAGLRYLRGIVRQLAGAPGAGTDLSRARNLDAVPFRAPDPINEILREEAARHHVPLVPLERIFRQTVPDHVPGAESFVEHLHPTFWGNARIASAVADELLHRPYASITRAEAGRLFRASDLTRLDLTLTDERIAQLLQSWPYTRSGTEAPPYPYRARSTIQDAVELLAAAGDSAGAAFMRGRDAEEEAFAQAVLKKRSDVLRAHVDLARARAARRDLEGARREYRAAVRLFPVDPGLWLELAQVCRMMGDRPATAWAADQALFLHPGAGDAQGLLDWARSPETQGANPPVGNAR